MRIRKYHFLMMSVAVALIRKFASRDVLIYADPPYVIGTRSQKQYNVEMSDEHHIELLKALLDHPGPVILSGYDSDLYNDHLKGWTKLSRHTTAERGFLVVSDLPNQLPLHGNLTD